MGDAATVPQPQPQSPESLAFVRRLGVGALAGGLARVALAPYDNLMRLMNIGTAEVENDVSYWARARRKLRAQGLRALVHNLPADLWRVVPLQALNFGLFDTYKRLLHVDPDGAALAPYALGTLGAGAAAGLSARVLLISTLLGPRLAPVQGPTFGARMLIRYRAAVAKGVGAAIANAAVYRAVYFAGYDGLKRALYGTSDATPGVWASLALAQAASYAGMLAAFPIDTVYRHVVFRPSRDNSSTATLIKIVRNCGVRELYKGASNLLFHGGGAALALVLYDQLSALLRS